MKKKFILFVSAAVLAMSATTMASIGMWWQRGDPGSTWQEWDFSTNASPASPERASNPNGTASAIITVIGAVHLDPAGWYPDFLGGDGVWHGEFAQVTLDIPNYETPNSFKEVWVEVCFRGYLLPEENHPQYDGETYGPKMLAWLGGNPIEAEDIDMIGSPYVRATGTGWQILTIGWEIQPNSTREQIWLSFANCGADIDYIKVDTICTPEPITAVLLGLGGLSILKRRRQA